ncbi:MAG: hypothetical protein JRG91_21365 [Deltaproteobacteria bacterium]|nr:hypothetical protein [Deltaproteobacteria bacterium]
MKRSVVIAPALLVAVLLAACNVMEPVGLGEQACAQVSVAGTAVDAAPSMDEASASVIGISAEPWTVALVPGGPGFVRIDVLEDAGAVLFAGEAGVVRGLTFCGIDFPLPDPAPNGFCSEDIPEHVHLALPSGVWHLELESDSVDSVWLLLAPVAVAHDHEH